MRGGSDRANRVETAPSEAQVGASISARGPSAGGREKFERPRAADIARAILVATSDLRKKIGAVRISGGESRYDAATSSSQTPELRPSPLARALWAGLFCERETWTSDDTDAQPNCSIFFRG